jgi:hypothetical protein
MRLEIFAFVAFVVVFGGEEDDAEGENRPDKDRDRDKEALNGLGTAAGAAAAAAGAAAVAAERPASCIIILLFAPILLLYSLETAPVMYAEGEEGRKEELSCPFSPTKWPIIPPGNSWLGGTMCGYGEGM